MLGWFTLLVLMSCTIDPLKYQFDYPNDFEFVSVFYRDEESWGRWNTYQIELLESYALVAASNGLYVVDVSNPSEPVLVKVYESDWAEVDEMVIDDQYAFISSANVGLEIVDISDPTVPKKAGRYEYQNELATRVEAVGDFVYFYAPQLGSTEESSEPHWYLEDPYWLILDVSDPKLPRVATEVSGLAAPMAIRGNYLYAAGRWRDGDDVYGILQVIDVTEGANPVVVKELRNVGWIGDFVAADDIGYASVGSGIDFLDISEPSSPDFIRTDLGYIGSFPHFAVKDDLVVGDFIYALEVTVERSENSMNVEAEPHARLDWDRFDQLLCDEDVFPNYSAQSDVALELAECSNDLLSRQSNDIALSGEYVYVATEELGMLTFRLPER